MKKNFSVLLLSSCVAGALHAQQDKIIIGFNTDSTYQTIRNFSASDAWSAQFVGNWPDATSDSLPINSGHRRKAAKPIAYFPLYRCPLTGVWQFCLPQRRRPEHNLWSRY